MLNSRLSYKFVSLSLANRYMQVNQCQGLSQSLGKGWVFLVSSLLWGRGRVQRFHLLGSPKKMLYAVDSSYLEYKKHNPFSIFKDVQKKLMKKTITSFIVDSIKSITFYNLVVLLKLFLNCLLSGNSSLPRCFDVFNNPDPFFTQPAHDGDAAVSFPALPMQSSVIYSPPSSSAPSESSAASPMSSVDGWVINED